MGARGVFEVSVDGFIRVEVVRLQKSLMSVGRKNSCMEKSTFKKLIACSLDVFVKLVKLMIASSDGSDVISVTLPCQRVRQVYGESALNKARQESENEIERKENVRGQAALEVKLELWSGISGEQLRIELPTT